jgi:hypothetical protein
MSGLIIRPLLYLVGLALQAGDLDAATVRYTECLELVVEQSNRWWVADCLVEFAQIAGARGDLERAAQLSGTVATQFDALGVPAAFADRVTFDQAVAAWRTQLGEAAFTAAGVAGRAMSLPR